MFFASLGLFLLIFALTLIFLGSRSTFESIFSMECVLFSYFIKHRMRKFHR